MERILTEQSIINTYKEKQQEQCRLYCEYKKIKKQNKLFGYKRIANILGYSYGKTRWWHCGKHTPTPIQTTKRLKKKKLLPLDLDNPKLFLIVKVFGATFGDGGIFGNLNGIFLSSSELEAVKEFGKNLKQIFGDEIEKNSRIIEGGVYGHSWCYQNTNREIIRFFIALGAPLGDKSQTKLGIPNWILSGDEKIKDEFFGSLFGAELNVPKIHIEKNRLDTLSFGITATQKFEENRKKFLTQIAKYLNEKGIKTGKICINDHKKQNRKGEPTKIYRLLISTKFENVSNFMALTKINYCKYKKNKLVDTMNKFSEIKRQRFNDLLEFGYGEERILKLLNLKPASFYIISNYEDYGGLYKEENAGF